MRLLPSLGAALAALLVAAPVSAQNNLVTLAAFVTVRAENVPEFEEATAEHAQWHASQNDPQAWPAYQALTGHGEYVFIAPNMTWASLDNPALDMAEDIAHYSESGAEWAETEDFVMWTEIPGGNPPTDPTQYPIVQVFEFDINSGGQAAVMHAIARFNSALADTDVLWSWSNVISRDGPPSVFIAIWAESFEALGTPGPGPDVIMADQFGPSTGNLIMTEFSNATTARSSQIWVLRPDLSYQPAT